MSKQPDPAQRAEQLLAELRAACAEAAGVIKDHRAAIKSFEADTNTNLRQWSADAADAADKIRQYLDDFQATLEQRVEERMQACVNDWYEAFRTSPLGRELGACYAFLADMYAQHPERFHSLQEDVELAGYAEDIEGFQPHMAIKMRAETPAAAAAYHVMQPRGDYAKARERLEKDTRLAKASAKVQREQRERAPDRLEVALGPHRRPRGLALPDDLPDTFTGGTDG